MRLFDISNLYKLGWFLRAMLYRPLFGSFGFPGYLGRPVFLLGSRRAFFGERVRIFPGLRLEVHGEGKLFIGRNVAIGQNLHITCAGQLVIGEGTAITNNVTITDVVHVYTEIHTPVNAQPIEVMPTNIGRNCFIGAGSSILPGSILGEHCVVGSNSVVSGIFPSYCVIVGVPAKIVRQYDFQKKEWSRVGNE